MNKIVNYCDIMYNDILDFENNAKKEYSQALRKYTDELLHKISILSHTQKIIKISNFEEKYNKKVEELITFKITEKDFENFIKSSITIISKDE